MAENVSHEHIESAYRPAKEIVGKFGDSTEIKEAKRLLGIAESLTHEARERAKADRTEAVSAP